MTIDEAIEELTYLSYDPRGVLTHDESQACVLGSEALKAWREARQEWRRPSSVILPGETES